jgi:hypothetical protein
MSNRRHAADGEAGSFADEIGVGVYDAFADLRRYLFLVGAIGARGDDEDSTVCISGPKDQRFGDLCDRTADRRRRVGRCARAGIEFEYLVVVAEYAWTLSADGAEAGFMAEVLRGASSSELFVKMRRAAGASKIGSGHTLTEDRFELR